MKAAKKAKQSGTALYIWAKQYNCVKEMIQLSECDQMVKFLEGVISKHDNDNHSQG